MVGEDSYSMMICYCFSVLVGMFANVSDVKELKIVWSLGCLVTRADGSIISSGGRDLQPVHAVWIVRSAASGRRPSAHYDYAVADRSHPALQTPT